VGKEPGTTKTSTAANVLTITTPIQWKVDSDFNDVTASPLVFEILKSDSRSSSHFDIIIIKF